MALNGCIATLSINPTLSDSVPQNLNFTTELYDSHGYHSPTTNSSKFYAVGSGIYQFSMTLTLASGLSKIWNIYLTGSQDASPYADGPAIYGVLNSDALASIYPYTDLIEWTGWMNDGEYISATISQHSPNAYDVSPTISARAHFVKVGANTIDNICILGRTAYTSAVPAAQDFYKDTEKAIRWAHEWLDTNSMFTDVDPDNDPVSEEIHIPDTGYYEITTCVYDGPSTDPRAGWINYKIYSDATVLYQGNTLPWRQPHSTRWIGQITAGSIVRMKLTYVCTGGSPSLHYRTLLNDSLQRLPNICVRRII